MTKRLSIIILIFVAGVIVSCDIEKEERKKDSMVGLWNVEKVQVGEKEMTPNARWMHFKSDSTQVSGNGWLQHSVGSWRLEEEMLTIDNLNGIKDNAAPFQVELNQDKMLWRRTEDGQKVTVHLKRAEKIPTSEGNKLMGLWQLVLHKVGEEKSTNLEIDKKATLFLRWDNTYVKQGRLTSKEYGIYKIHGHRPELQMVNYGDTPLFSFYKFDIKKDKLVLKSTDGKEELEYKRIHQFFQ